MSLEELDRLKEENLERIKQIEERYFQSKQQAKPVIEALRDLADKREIKCKNIDSSLSYPTYGRGMDPNPNIDTYMINKGLSSEHAVHGKKHAQEEVGEKRPKIISPRRQKYESQFEKYFVQKLVDEVNKSVTEVKQQRDLGKFDTVTKLTESKNALVQRREQERKEKIKLRKSKKQEKSLQ